jgi:hypothetical protein
LTYIRSRKEEAVKMKKIVSATILLLVIGSMLCGIVAAVEEPFGPAPDSGDGEYDGGGFHTEEGSVSPWANNDAPGDSVGPAPNSGDGDPDGSGF